MNSKEFAEDFYKEKLSLLKMYFDESSNSEVTQLIKDLNLDVLGRERIRQVINGVLSDSLYTILLGLDGAAKIGDNQTDYKLLNENNQEITDGEIESFAWEYFHNNKYHIENSEYDFIAHLEYNNNSEGRSTPVFSGYRPQVKFEFDEMQTSGMQKFIEREVVFPGDKVTAEIRIIGVDYFAGKLEEGMNFEFREVSRVIGKGKILSIINEKLRKKTSR